MGLCFAKVLWGLTARLVTALLRVPGERADGRAAGKQSTPSRRGPRPLSIHTQPITCSPPLPGTLAPMSPCTHKDPRAARCFSAPTLSLAAFFSLPLKGTQDTKFFPLLLLSSPSPLPLIPSTQLRSRGFPFLPTPLPFYYYYYFFNLSFSFNFQGQHGQTMPPVPV